LSFENSFEAYKRFCYIFGQSFDKNPNRDITKLIYQADLEMTPGMFTSLWLVTTVLSGLLMLILSSILLMLPQSPVHIESPYVYILLIALIGAGASAIGFLVLAFGFSLWQDRQVQTLRLLKMKENSEIKKLLEKLLERPQ